MLCYGIGAYVYLTQHALTDDLAAHGNFFSSIASRTVSFKQNVWRVEN